MFFEWSLLSAVTLAGVFLFVKMFYYKSITEKGQRSNNIMKGTLQEAEILIRKYQIQLQRSLGNLELLNEEVNKLKNDLKAIKNRNSQLRVENEQLKRKIRELENKIEALL